MGVDGYLTIDAPSAGAVSSASPADGITSSAPETSTAPAAPVAGPALPAPLQTQATTAGALYTLISAPVNYLTPQPASQPTASLKPAEVSEMKEEPAAAVTYAPPEQEAAISTTLAADQNADMTFYQFLSKHKVRRVILLIFRLLRLRSAEF